MGNTRNPVVFVSQSKVTAVGSFSVMSSAFAPAIVLSSSPLLDNSERSGT